MNAEIIGIGSELLLGQISNTNAQYISQALSGIGINVYYHTSVGDNRIRALEVLDIAFKRSELIIITGGLGPTLDDLTKETVAEFLGLEIVLDQYSAETIKDYLKKRGVPVTANNIKQAMFPVNSTILPNDRGTAPGAIVEKDGRLFVMLPGPPYEMQHMLEKYVLPHLVQYSHDQIVSKVLKIYGVGESMVEEKIRDLLVSQSNPTIAPLADYGKVTLRLTAKCRRSDDPTQIIKPIENEIRQRLGNVIYGTDDESLEAVVASLLHDKALTLAIAESCTGGLISHLMTNIPGISNNLLESVVVYSDRSKIERLKVKSETIQVFGAVSQETAFEMALGIMQTAGSDLGLAVTGIAGPSGASLEKPIGLVYIAIASIHGVEGIKYELHGDRNRIKSTASNNALNMLRLKLLDWNV